MKEKDDIHKRISKILLDGAKKIKNIKGNTEEEKWASLLDNLLSPHQTSIIALSKELSELRKLLLKLEKRIDKIS